MKRLIVAAAAALMVSASAYAEPPLPKFAGEPVIDTADVLPPPTERALNVKLRAIHEKAGHQVAVVIIPSLGGADLDDYVNRSFRNLKLGSAEKNDGVLLFVSVGDRKNRIEVGYGLEAVLPDAKTVEINRDQILPSFRAGDLATGIDNGVTAIGEVINAPVETPVATLKSPEPESEGLGWWWLLILGVPSLFGAGLVLARSENKRKKAQREADELERSRRSAENYDNLLRASVARAEANAGKPRRVGKEPALGMPYGKATPPPPPVRRTKPVDPTPSYSAPSYETPSYSPPPPPPSSSDYGSSSSSSSFDGGGGSSGGGGSDGSW